MKSYLIFAVNSLLHKKLRSSLTILGIVIGIAAIVALISIGSGLENAITEQFEMIGTNRIYIYPESSNILAAAQGIQGLTDDDIKSLESMGYFDWVGAYVLGTGIVKYKNKDLSLTLYGLTNEDFEERYSSMNLNILDGRYFVDGEKGGVILGNSVAYKYFDTDLRANNHIKINEEDFKVVGVFDKIGNEQDDGTIYMVLEDARELIGLEDDVHFIEGAIKEGQNLNEVVPKISRKLERARGNDNFEIVTPEELLDQFNSILGILQIVLAGIAGISLFVGGVGIMNSMFTNILERTSEIGIMKSIGATNFDILFFFLTESALVGIVGGVLGGLLGTGIALSIGFIAQSYGVTLLKIVPDVWLIIFGILFAFVLGAGAGFVPAWQASKLKPVEALRK